MAKADDRKRMLFDWDKLSRIGQHSFLQHNALFFFFF